MPAAWFAEDPDADATSPEAVYAAACKYVAAGLSVIPIDADEPSKSPCPRRMRSWKVYQLRLPRPEELKAWYEVGGHFGLAVIAGRVSGGARGFGLEIVDFDSLELAAPWIENVEARAPGLTRRLVMVMSPRPGLHCYYRTFNSGECEKLASAPAMDEQGRVILDEAGHQKKATLIELKAEGGYCLAPPSPRRCHPRNQLYRLLEGSPDLTQVPTITNEEHAILLEEARKFNRWTEMEPKPVTSPTRTDRRHHDGNRPGDDFDRRATWAEILEPHGWVLVRQRGEIEDWRRPGKGDGISATTNYENSGLLYVFSTNGYPFEEGRGYSKFAAFATLNHGGDYTAAARKLQEERYGPPQLPAGKRSASGGVRTINMDMESQQDNETKEGE
jgi:putative DNA primase/helicase